MDEWIRQIADAPDDDRLRLVYADHLMQQGDARGELIAVQVALAHHEATDDDVDADKLGKRERELLDANHDAWIMRPREILSRAMSFRRGFLEHAQLADAQELADAFSRLRPVAPLLRAVDIRSNLGAFGRSPELATIDEIVSHDVPGHAELQALAAADTRLAKLTIAANGVGDAALVEVVELPQPLVELAFGLDGRPGTRMPVLARLAATPARASLRALRLRRVADLVEVQLAVRALPALEELRLEGTPLTAPELTAIVAAAPRLTTLDISDTRKAEIDIVGVLAAGKRLRRLRLSGLGLTSAHATAIAGSPDARRLVRLDLRDNQIGEFGARLLLESEHLQQLKRINLNKNRFSPYDKKKLREMPLAKRAQTSIR